MGERAMRGYKTYSLARGRHILRRLMMRLDTDLYTAYVYGINKAADNHFNMVDYLQHVDMLEAAYIAMCEDGEE